MSNVGLSPPVQMQTVTLMRVFPLMQTGLNPFSGLMGPMPRSWGHGEVPYDIMGPPALKACTHPIMVFSLHTQGLDLATWSTEMRTEG